jgi:hypothetical protein
MGGGREPSHAKHQEQRSPRRRDRRRLALAGKRHRVERAFHHQLANAIFEKPERCTGIEKISLGQPGRQYRRVGKQVADAKIDTKERDFRVAHGRIKEAAHTSAQTDGQKLGQSVGAGKLLNLPAGAVIRIR